MTARFFLSYARADEDGYVARFFDDLTREVQRQSGVGGDESGFLDHASLRVGSAWPQELMNALNNCRTFVALCSPSYFASEFCGREWSVFTARQERYRSAHGRHPGALVPVIWVPSPDTPEAVDRIQRTDPAFGAVYAKQGLYHLLRLRRYREDYLIFLEALAKRLVEMASGDPVPPLDPAFPMAEVRSAFHPDQGRPDAGSSWQRFASGLPHARTAPPTVTRGRRPGPQHVYFVIVSAPQRELVGVRDELHHYGQEPFDWAPYRPELDQRISVFAQAVAADQDLSSQLAEAPEVLDVLERAGARNELVVLLVDVWTTRIDAYRGHMVEYDRRNEPSSAVMVPWSDSDAEANDNAERLYQDLETAFPKNTIRRDDLFRIRIGTSAAFRDQLAEVLLKAQSRVFRTGEAGRWTGRETWPERPMMQFPDRKADQ